MPTSTPPCRGRSPPSTATPARPRWCANRLLVQDGVHERFAAKLAEAVSQFVGPGLAEGTNQGPLIDENAVRKVEEHIADAVSKGARILTGGKRHPLGGTFFEPTILADVTPQDESCTRGDLRPGGTALRFHTEEEAIRRMANDTEFGLAAYFYTESSVRVWRAGAGRLNTASSASIPASSRPKPPHSVA